jgi:NAD(P)-dependent dehydrogenase (short-subunit alcohol dehydrogenase family)
LLNSIEQLLPETTSPLTHFFIPQPLLISSQVGSISDNTTGGMYAYRSSKTAANQIGRNLSIDLKPKGITVLLLHPGIVKTPLLPDVESKEAVMPDEAAGKLWKNVVSQKGMESTGTFWHREGWEIGW